VNLKDTFQNYSIGGYTQVTLTKEDVTYRKGTRQAFWDTETHTGKDVKCDEFLYVEVQDAEFYGREEDKIIIGYHVEPRDVDLPAICNENREEVDSLEEAKRRLEEFSRNCRVKEVRL
jgi:hypothetical protein